MLSFIPLSTWSSTGLGVKRIRSSLDISITVGWSNTNVDDSSIWNVDWSNSESSVVPRESSPKSIRLASRSIVSTAMTCCAATSTADWIWSMLHSLDGAADCLVLVSPLEVALLDSVVFPTAEDVCCFFIVMYGRFSWSSFSMAIRPVSLAER